MLHQEIAIPVPDPMNLEYSEEGDEPLASDHHYAEQIFCFDVLYERFAGPDAYVSFQRWLRRDPEGKEPMLQPDILVALGVEQRNRRIYDPWEEGKPPDLVGEYLSPSSLTADQRDKIGEYRRLGIREYWLFNPAGELQGPRVWGGRIRGWDLQAPGEATPLPAASDGSLPSRVLPIRFAIVEDRLEVLDGPTGAILSPLQVQRRRIAEAEARQREADEARQLAEAEAQRLRAELERLSRERTE